MHVSSMTLRTDERPDLADLAPFFERPAAIRIDGSEGLEIFRINCLYRLRAEAERVAILMPTYMFARLGDGRLELVAFRLARPRTTEAYDEAREAFMTIRLYAEALPADEGHRRRLTEGAAFLEARWHADEAILRRLLVPPFSGAST